MESFTASRWTRGNFWFPAHIDISEHDVTYRKNKLFGSETFSLSLRQVASIILTTGMIFAELSIESSGGHQIIVHGMTNKDARRIKELVDEARGKFG